MALKDLFSSLFDISDNYDRIARFHHDVPPWGYAPGAHPRQWDPMAVLRRVEDRKDPTRIGIVGAGAAGIHLAWLLKRRGFQDVTLLEQSGRVGGKVHTVEHGGFRHELGACYTTPAYHEVRAMLAMFGLDEYIPVAGRTVYDEDNRGSEFGDWVAAELKASLKADGDWRHRLPSKLLILLVLFEINRYNRIFHKMFGKFDGQLPPRPAPETMKMLDCSFIDFLKDNKLELLVPLMRLFQSAQGYGYLEDVPAFYGLMWNNPDTLKIAPEQLTAEPKSGEKGNDYPGGNLVAKGMIRLYQAMVSDQDLQIRLHQQVQQIRRGDEVEVDTVDTQTGAQATHRFDRLVIAANARQALGWLAEPTDAEQELFHDQVVHGMTTSLQVGIQKDRHAIDSWFYNVRPGGDHRVITQRLTEAFFNDRFDSKPRDRPDARVTFQYGAVAADEETIDRLYDEHYEKFGVQDAETVGRFYWLDYFPHWKNAGGVMAQKPWRVLDIQGDTNTYWVGGSVSFESLNDITCYNLLLMHQHFDQA